MKWTGLNELREKYLEFFESKEHLRLPSFPLIPQNDNSLLLINSGMAPMKKYFTGEITPPRKRVTTCQKCIRTPDIERVGKTARHGTYFEMLGNFSFGDYFKHEATEWAWEFCTKVLELPVDKIWVSIYENDEETKKIWVEERGVAEDHIVRLGKEDNFWEHGVGPCGPCSELYFDRGAEKGCGSPDCKVGCECDRYVEFWNLVFTQFNSDGNDNYTPLDNPNIDTGMGLERLACILQNVDNLFEVDTVQNIMKHICEISGVKYRENEQKDVSLRVITDHIRSTTMMIGDGVMPSNEGRGYVLRRLLRRAARHGRLLGIEKPFLSEVALSVIAENKSAYPNLEEKKDFITKLIKFEEESFSKTIDTGLQLLNNIIETSNSKTLSGEDAFKLNDTYGFPLDLTKEILEERGMSVDEDKFNELMKEQKIRAKSARKNATAEAWKGSKSVVEQLEPTDFVGYEKTNSSSKIIAIIKNGEIAESISDEEEGIIVLDNSPFYAQSGGQIGDIGTIKTTTSVFEVTDTSKTHNSIFLHAGKASGTMTVGDSVETEIDAERRNAIKRNHTAAHLLQAALREVLGTHVEQAGQLVDEKNVRFDFTHFSALTADEIAKVEAKINSVILSGIEVINKEMPIDEARKLGAMALFGEKYGDVVRVVKVNDFSIELCGGTHVENVAKIGLFKIVSESSVAAGVRRIEAVTALNVLDYLNANLDLLNKSAQALKLSNVDDILRRSVQITAELKEKDKELESLKSKIASSKINSLLENATEVGAVKIVTGKFTDTDADAVRKMCDSAKSSASNIVVVLAGISGEKLTFACACAKDAVASGAHAGNIVRNVSKITGGSGGGRPDSAMAGGKMIDKTDEALNEVVNIVSSMLK